MKLKFVSFISFLTLIIAHSASGATLDLATKTSTDAAASAKSLGVSLDNSVWTFNCGKGDIKFKFDASGSVTQVDLWKDFTWAVTAPRTVSLTGIDGNRVYFIFDISANSYNLVSWGNELCSGRRVS